MESFNRIKDFFEPRSIAIIGASEEVGRIGSGLYLSITQEFSGEVFLVNPKYDRMFDQLCYRSVKDLPIVPSHAMIAVPRMFVIETLNECVEKGIQRVVIITAGFKEADELGSEMEKEIKKICKDKGVLLLGPNTLGMINTKWGLNATFLPNRFKQGQISVISQSGGVGMALLASLEDQRAGISKWIGIGNESVMTAIDLLNFFAEDPDTQAIAVCFESISDLPEFLKTASRINSQKPIVILRDGKSSVGVQAAVSHTGKMAQPDPVMVALLRQYGLLEAKSTRECAVMLKALVLAPLPNGNRTMILTNTAGPAILASDLLQPEGIDLPTPTPQLQDSIDSEAEIPMKLKNPGDISSFGLNPKIYGIAARHLIHSDEADLLLGIFSMNPHLRLPDKELIDVAQSSGKPVVACFLSSFREFSDYSLVPESFGIPCFYDVHDAAIAVKALVNCGKSRRRPASKLVGRINPDSKSKIDVILKERQEFRDVIMTERESRLVLKMAGIDNFIPRLIKSEDEAVSTAADLGFPLVMKIHSERVTHKSDAGGVRLNIRTKEDLLEAYSDLRSILGRVDPKGELTLQPMEPNGFELIAGGVRTDSSGTLIMAGTGGIYSEVYQDMVFRINPISRGEGKEMLNELRSAPILNGFRGGGLAVECAKQVLETLSMMLEEFPAIKEIEINPYRVYSKEIRVLDARIVLMARQDI